MIPEEDIAALKSMGVAEVFTPGSSIADMAEYIRNHVQNYGATAPAVAPALKVDHIGIAVKSITDVIHFYTQQLGVQGMHEEIIADQQVKAVFLPLGETDIELLEPTSPDSPIARFLEQRGPGLHHVAYAVEDVAEALRSAKAAGYRLIDEVPRPGGQGKMIGFVHPKDTHGALTEFCQRMPVSSGEDGT